MSKIPYGEALTSSTKYVMLSGSAYNSLGDTSSYATRSTCCLLFTSPNGDNLALNFILVYSIIRHAPIFPRIELIINTIHSILTNPHQRTSHLKRKLLLKRIFCTILHREAVVICPFYPYNGLDLNKSRTFEQRQAFNLALILEVYYGRIAHHWSLIQG